MYYMYLYMSAAPAPAPASEPVRRRLQNSVVFVCFMLHIDCLFCFARFVFFMFVKHKHTYSLLSMNYMFRGRLQNEGCSGKCHGRRGPTARGTTWSR